MLTGFQLFRHSQIDGNLVSLDECQRLKGWQEPTQAHLNMILKLAECSIARRLVAADLVAACLQGNPKNRLQSMDHVLEHPFFAEDDQELPMYLSLSHRYLPISFSGFPIFLLLFPKNVNPVSVPQAPCATLSLSRLCLFPVLPSLLYLFFYAFVVMLVTNIKQLISLFNRTTSSLMMRSASVMQSLSMDRSTDPAIVDGFGPLNADVMPDVILSYNTSTTRTMKRLRSNLNMLGISTADGSQVPPGMDW